MDQMYRFMSSWLWKRPMPKAGDYENNPTQTQKSDNENPERNITTPLNTSEYGDPKQPFPHRQKSITHKIQTLYVFGKLCDSLEEQDNTRWNTCLKAMGFDRKDQDAPLGFEDFDWSPIFPPDREHVARLLEPVVARSEDIQEAINRMSEAMMRTPHRIA